MHRLLAPGGRALIVSEPVWTSARGHHVHQWPDVAPHVDPWEHLRYSEQEFRRVHQNWPACSRSLEEIAHWIYHSPEINRAGAAQLRAALRNSGFRFDWFIEYPEEASLAPLASEVSAICGVPASDLLVLGFSAMGRK